MLNFIGLGLNDKKDISVKGLEAVKKSDYVFLENYTAILNLEDLDELETFYGGDIDGFEDFDKSGQNHQKSTLNSFENLRNSKSSITLANREMVESRSDEILSLAKNKIVSFLVVGDIFSATTHTDLFLRAVEIGIECNFIHNASVMNAIGITGLQLYKFGKTTSLVYPEKNYFPETAYDVIKENKKNKLHTLVLLDIKVDLNRYMSVNEAVDLLEQMEQKREEKVITKDLLMVGCARLGSKDFRVKVGTKEDVKKFDFGEPMHCLIIPGEMHFKEEEMLDYWKKRFN